MAETICYVKLNRNIELTADDVYLKDLGSVRCADKTVAAKVKSMKVYKFRAPQAGKSADIGGGSAKSGNIGSPKSGSPKSSIKGNSTKDGEKRCVISVLKIIALIEETCPGVTVQSVGEAEVLVERVNPEAHKRWQLVLKIVFVSLICFCGTAFTIMAYHNDIVIADAFSQIYRIVMGSEPQGLNVLEVSYSIGLVLGIIIFFNHVGGRRLTKDPTPIEVEMRKYEYDVNDTLVENAEREGRTIDVE